MAKNDKEIQKQIQILATNLEILNQKLNQDPDALISPGEKAIKDSIEDVAGKIEYMQNVIKSTQMTNNLKSEKEAFAVEATKLSRIISNLKKFDRDWIAQLLQQISQFNATSEQLSKNLEVYSNQTHKMFDTQRAEIIKNVYYRLYRSLKKDNLMMMGFTTVLSSTVALIVLMILLYTIQ